MPSARSLASTAFLLLCVPALGAAAPYLPVVVPDPAREQLVEGHTVFTVIEVNRTTEVDGDTRFAAAVAVLVRERVSEPLALRFPGVLWFNDQYLVAPSTAPADVRIRYPCGGAVMAVNRGDPDPRMAFVNVHAQAGPAEAGGPSAYPAAVDAYADADGGQANVSTTTGYADDTDLQTPQRTPSPHPSVPSEPLPNWRFRASYVESYQIVDPNDHTWVVDLYRAYYRATLATDRLAVDDRVYEYPVWVVNVLGSTTFVPDDGSVDCAPFHDAIQALHGTVAPLTDQDDVDPTPIPYPADPTPPPEAPRQVPGTPYPDSARLSDGRCDGRDGRLRNDTARHIPAGYPHVKDDPCGGYASPGANGDCYGGQASAGGGCGTAAKPLRLYNALLYFKFEHLRAAGTVRNHSSGSSDTNGCQVGTEWSCPEGLDPDHMEGNSHPFHPTPHAAHQEAGAPCHPTTDGTNQPNAGTNHGGSASATWDPDAGTYGPAPCEALHATRDVDVYYSPTGRPVAPLERIFRENDQAGSDAPFHHHDEPATP